MPRSSSSTSPSLDDDMQKMKRCKYCLKGGHTNDKCKKLAQWNEFGMSIIENTCKQKMMKLMLLKMFGHVLLHVNMIHNIWLWMRFCVGFFIVVSQSTSLHAKVFLHLWKMPKGAHMICANMLLILHLELVKFSI